MIYTLDGLIVGISIVKNSRIGIRSMQDTTKNKPLDTN